MKTLQRGFTLIELLVVIAIIGILSSIVLASLSSARNGGTNAAITSSLSNMRAQAELFAGENSGVYHTTAGATINSCASGIFAATSTGGLKNLVTDLQLKAGATNVSCTASSTVWVVRARLAGSPAGTACADSSGNSVSSTTGSYSTTTGACTI